MLRIEPQSGTNLRVIVHEHIMMRVIYPISRWNRSALVQPHIVLAFVAHRRGRLA